MVVIIWLRILKSITVGSYRFIGKFMLAQCYLAMNCGQNIVNAFMRKKQKIDDFILIIYKYLLFYYYIICSGQITAIS